MSEPERIAASTTMTPTASPMPAAEPGLRKGNPWDPALRLAFGGNDEVGVEN